MPNQVLNLDFRSLIGGPLTASIEAQSDAALATVSFINSVGKDKDGKPTTVTFNYGDGIETKAFNVPLLTIIPIPNITIKDITIDFNAKISSVEKQESSLASKLGFGLEIGAAYGGFSAKLNASYSRQQKSSRSGERKKEYNMHIVVKAGQDDPPPGIDTLVNFLETLVTPVISTGNTNPTNPITP